MSISRIDPVNDTIARTCSACGADHTFAMEDLHLGFHFSSDQINLPECPCGAQESLLRPAPDCDMTRCHAHAAMVAGLAKLLISKGRVRGVSRTESADEYREDLKRGLRAGRAAAHNFDTENYDPPGSPDFSNPDHVADCNEQCGLHGARIKKSIAIRKEVASQTEEIPRNSARARQLAKVAKEAKAAEQAAKR